MVAIVQFTFSSEFIYRVLFGKKLYSIIIMSGISDILADWDNEYDILIARYINTSPNFFTGLMCIVCSLDIAKLFTLIELNSP